MHPERRQRGVEAWWTFLGGGELDFSGVGGELSRNKHWIYRQKSGSKGPSTTDHHNCNF